MTKKEKQLKIYQYLFTKECQKCGEKDVIVLEFHHINPETKFKSISELVNKNYDWDVIEKEIRKCQILCCNCHRRETAYEGNFYKLNEDEYYGEISEPWFEGLEE